MFIAFLLFGFVRFLGFRFGSFNNVEVVIIFAKLASTENHLRNFLDGDIGKMRPRLGRAELHREGHTAAGGHRAGRRYGDREGGGIGAADPIEIESTSLTADSTGNPAVNPDGNINLTELTGTLVVDDVQAGTGTVTLTAMAGAIDALDAAPTIEVTAATINLDATAGISLDISGRTITANVTGVGADIDLDNTATAAVTAALTTTGAEGATGSNILFDQTGNQTLNLTASTVDGDITVSNAGAVATLTATSVSAGDDVADAIADVVQTGKTRRMPIILVHEPFWRGLLDWFRSTLVAERTLDAADDDDLVYAAARLATDGARCGHARVPPRPRVQAGVVPRRLRPLRLARRRPCGARASARDRHKRDRGGAVMRKLASVLVVLLCASGCVPSVVGIIETCLARRA